VLGHSAQHDPLDTPTSEAGDGMNLGDSFGKWLVLRDGERLACMFGMGEL
jgi:hypothetical protein